MQPNPTASTPDAAPRVELAICERESELRDLVNKQRRIGPHPPRLVFGCEAVSDALGILDVTRAALIAEQRENAALTAERDNLRSRAEAAECALRIASRTVLDLRESQRPWPDGGQSLLDPIREGE